MRLPFPLRVFSSSLLLLALAGCGARSPFDDTLSSPGPTPTPPRTDPPQHVYVVDSHGASPTPGRIVRFDDFTGAGWTTFDGGGLDLNGACSPALDGAQRLYFGLAHPLALVRMDNMSGDGLTLFEQPGTGDGQLAAPSDVALDAEGRIYVADFVANRVMRMDDMSGAGWTALGGPDAGAGEGQLDGPIGVAVSPSGKILVADTNNGRLVEVDDLSGAGWATWEMPAGATGPSRPSGVSYDSDGRLYAIDFENSVLYRMDSIAGDGIVTFSAPQLVQLSHVFVHGSGRIFLGSLNKAHAVSVMDDMTGAGLVTLGGYGDGVGQFRNPCGVVAW